MDLVECIDEKDQWLFRGGERQPFAKSLRGRVEFGRGIRQAAIPLGNLFAHAAEQREAVRRFRRDTNETANAHRIRKCSSGLPGGFGHNCRFTRTGGAMKYK